MRDRIIKIATHYFPSNMGFNKQAFANAIGSSQQNVTNYVTNRQPSLEFISKILEAYPEISAEWLMRGEGQMLRGRHISVEPSEKEHVHVYEGFFEDEESSMVKENEADELKDMMAMFAKKFEKFVDHNFKPCD